MSRLKQIREEQNLTQEELSEKAGISVRTIQRIEAGTIPKGYTLKAICKTLNIEKKDLLSEEISNIDLEENKIINDENLIIKPTDFNLSKVKLINLSSIPFIIFPPLNIIIPLALSYFLKQRNEISKQLITVQILWTILAPILFLLGIFLKLGRQFTLVLMISIFLSNLFIILRNAYELDKKNKLHYKLNFNIL